MFIECLEWITHQGSKISHVMSNNMANNDFNLSFQETVFSGGQQHCLDGHNCAYMGDY